MTHIKYWVVDDEEEEEPDEIKYSNILQEEEYEEDPPEGFEGLQKGLSLEESSGEAPPPIPWDPSQSFFAYI